MVFSDYEVSMEISELSRSILEFEQCRFPDESLYFEPKYKRKYKTKIKQMQLFSNPCPYFSSKGATGVIKPIISAIFQA